MFLIGTNKVIKFFYTGIRTDSIYHKNQMELRELSFSHNKHVVVIENIFFYKKVDEHTHKSVIPMVVINC